MNQQDPAADPYGVGSAAQEAARLFEAVTGWAAAHLGDATGHSASTSADEEAAAGEQPEQHNRGGSECRYCPLCRSAHALREASPEVMHHLTEASLSLMQAANAVWSSFVTPGRPEHASPAEPTSTVEHIDLDDEPSGETTTGQETRERTDQSATPDGAARNHPTNDMKNNMKNNTTEGPHL